MGKEIATGKERVLEIRLLYFRGCPHFEDTLNLLRDVMKELGVKGDIELVEIRGQEDAEKYNFFGSPSIQINGVDIERTTGKPFFGCRVYTDEEGNKKGLPPRSLLMRALRSAITKSNTSSKFKI
jgi:hypothetical protein